MTKHDRDWPWMIASDAPLAAGDLVWVDFNPPFGHEQAGRRPALVVSDRRYNAISSLLLVCPITRSEKAWPFKVRLDETAPIKGQVLVDQIKSVDRRRIVSPSIGSIGTAALADILACLTSLLAVEADDGRRP